MHVSASSQHAFFLCKKGEIASLYPSVVLSSVVEMFR